MTEPSYSFQPTFLIPSRQVREGIRKVGAVDPLECPKCGVVMKIVSFIDEAPAIEKILRHLGLWVTDNPGKAPPEIDPQDETEIQPFDDGWPCYEEPSIALH